MKRFVLFVLSLSAIQLIAQDELPLNQGWKFCKGDDLSWAAPDFNDAGWTNIAVDRIWEQQGYDPYDGFAWFRLRVYIPSSLKNSGSLRDSLLIYLGKINNFDQTYLNGHLIGVNGFPATDERKDDMSFIKAPTNYWDRKRPYKLPLNSPLIRWDAENVIAVRVYDEGGQGGMYTGDQILRLTRLSDYVEVDFAREAFVLREKEVVKNVYIKNLSSRYTIVGKFEIEAHHKISDKEFMDRETKVTLKPGEERVFNVTLPQLDHAMVVKYEFEIEGEKKELQLKEETPYILTPPVPDAPRINGPSITGVRPGRPFLYVIPASGKRPLKFRIEKLPEGLVYNPNTGIISGNIEKPGDYKMVFHAMNDFGEARREFTLRVGDQICLTPPMGWNSWNCWGLSVDEEKVKASADMFVEKGLRDHGWLYINIDDGWEIYRDQEPKRDAEGNIHTNEKFPDMKRLGDYIHSLGLRFGIYSSPGPLTCGQYTGSYRYELNDARSYAKWRIDYLKYDWCSYDGIAKDTSLAERKKPYIVMRQALDQVDRDIVYSLCQYGMSKVWRWGAEVGGNLWRTTGDITDTWESLREIGFSQVENQPYAGPGHWNDPDMLVVGNVGWGPNIRPSRLTPDEQYTHISLWCLLSAPLLLGCDLQSLDEFTLNLLTNDEVLALNQDTLGYQARQALVDGDVQVWVKQLADGTYAFGIFNLGEKTARYRLGFEKVGLPVKGNLRDVWRQQPAGNYDKEHDFVIPSHGVVLMKTY
ncbi:MAG: putative Ig domain-containing protein [Bacteroidales bacterium]